ncbi:MAG: biotin/lipoate A/B protein ligase family protein, partial [Candidatus Bathyarchaeia archaeon]|nr:lipoate--protein ligase family protein [Candidatus Bathyarchaeota archaeon]
MEAWRLIDLGLVEPLVAQAFYEAVAEALHRGLVGNTLILLQPASPYVCVGYHQDLEREIDLDYCQKKGLPVIRRSQGGGATYLDSNQVFYQIVARDSPVVPRNIDEMFRRLLMVTVETYRRLGVDASFKPINDVVVGDRKISGNGAGLHESVSILVGNIILDLDYDAMASVLRVPDEKFRDKIAKSMKDWVTSLRRELGYAPSAEEVKRIYRSTFQEILGLKLLRSEPTIIEWRIFQEEVKPRHTSKEWLYMESPKAGEGRAVKIAGDVKVAEIDYKAKKLIRVRAEIKGNKILSINIRGDFFAVPKEAVGRLEELLIGLELEREPVSNAVERFYRDSGAQIIGVEPIDLSNAVLKLKEYL